MEDHSLNLIALLELSDISLFILRNLNASGYFNLCLTCVRLNEWLKSTGEALMRILCIERAGNAALVRPRMGESFAEFYLRHAPGCVLGLIEMQGEIGWIETDRVSCLAIPDASLTSSPDGKLVAWTHGMMLHVKRLHSRTNVKSVKSFRVSDSTVYAYFDASSSILTWLSFAGRTLNLNWIDLTNYEMHTAPFAGSPLFWHLSPTNPQLCLAHTSRRVMLLNLFGNEIGNYTTLLEADLSTSCQVRVFWIFFLSQLFFQVVHLVDNNRYFIVSSGRHLLCLPVKNRTKEESEQLLEQAKNGESEHVLMEFQTEGVVSRSKKKERKNNFGISKNNKIQRHYFKHASKMIVWLLAWSMKFSSERFGT